MATAEGAFDLRRLAAQVVLVGLVVTVALSDFGNPVFAVVGFLSGLLLVLAAVDAVHEHPLYPVAFGTVIVLAGVAGIAINGLGFFRRRARPRRTCLSRRLGLPAIRARLSRPTPRRVPR